MAGKPKTVKPITPERFITWSLPTSGSGPFKCAYCGRYGQPGACEGCGAPNQPAPARGFRSDAEARAFSDLWRAHYSASEGRVAVLPPAFPMVKR